MAGKKIGDETLVLSRVEVEMAEAAVGFIAAPISTVKLFVYLYVCMSCCLPSFLSFFVLPSRGS